MGVMPTADQSHSARLHGEALVAARDLVDAPELDELLGRLADASDGPAQRAEVAARLAGDVLSVLTVPSIAAAADHAELARHLIAAGLILESGPIDRDRLGQLLRGQPNSL